MSSLAGISATWWQVFPRGFGRTSRAAASFLIWSATLITPRPGDEGSIWARPGLSAAEGSGQ